MHHSLHTSDTSFSIEFFRLQVVIAGDHFGLDVSAAVEKLYKYCTDNQPYPAPWDKVWRRLVKGVHIDLHRMLEGADPPMAPKRPLEFPSLDEVVTPEGELEEGDDAGNGKARKKNKKLSKGRRRLRLAKRRATKSEAPGVGKAVPGGGSLSLRDVKDDMSTLVDVNNVLQADTEGSGVGKEGYSKGVKKESRSETDKEKRTHTEKRDAASGNSKVTSHDRYAVFLRALRSGDEKKQTEVVEKEVKSRKRAKQKQRQQKIRNRK